MKAVVYTIAVALGAALMSFEMIASRYLTPFFGSGINTWAALIAVVLLALTFGYLLGGYLIDRYPTLRLAALFAGIAALWFLLVPVFSEPILFGIMDNIESEVVGVLVGACILQLVPITALGTYSPIAVRLLMDNVKRSGSISGVIYGVSTFGSILGTLGTPLLVIPNVGSRAATYGLAAVCFVCALVLWFGGGRRARGLEH